MKIRFLLLLCIFLTLSSCQEKYVFRMSENPGYADVPVLAVRALDGDRWIEGQIDEETRTVSFEFRVLDDLSNVPVKVSLNGEWPRMVSPEQPLFEANLESQFKFTVNDGVDAVSYEMTAAKYGFIKNVTLSVEEETVSCSIGHLNAEGKFREQFLYSDLHDVKVEIETGDDVSLVIPKNVNLGKVDFTEAGRSLTISLRDERTGHLKAFSISARPADVVNIDGSWTDVTSEYKSQHGLSSDFSQSVRIYITDNLNYSEGNIGYLMTIPAGKVNMQVLEKSRLGGDTNAKISSVVRNNRDYSIFFYMNGPGVWRIDGGLKDIESNAIKSDVRSYYSPLAYTRGEVLRQEGWNGNRENIMYAPALAVKDGKAMIAPARTDMDANRLYRYSDAAGNGGQDWSDVDCAIGGYFMIVHDGDNLVTGRGDVLVQYSKTWRTFPGYDEDGKCLLTNYTTQNWSALVPVTDHDALRIGRHAVGVTERGDLVLFSVEKYLNTHNQGQGKYDKMNGAVSDPYGLTLSELSFIMSEMGCSDAMTIEDYAWCSFVLQNGGERGHDLFMVNSRYNFNTGEMKAESSEFVNLVIACFK